MISERQAAGRWSGGCCMGLPPADLELRYADVMFTIPLQNNIEQISCPRKCSSINMILPPGLFHGGRNRSFYARLFWASFSSKCVQVAILFKGRLKVPPIGFQRRWDMAVECEAVDKERRAGTVIGQVLGKVCERQQWKTRKRGVWCEVSNALCIRKVHLISYMTPSFLSRYVSNA